jgi:formylglycine-generating enzyme required for sulfatase activity
MTRKVWKLQKISQQRSKTEMRPIILSLIAVVSFSPAPAQWLDAQEGSSAFAPTLSNKATAPGKAPESMVWIPGGEFSMGAVMTGQGSAEMPMASNDSGPVHRVRVDGFWMDTTSVTNEQFEKFVKATA